MSVNVNVKHDFEQEHMHIPQLLALKLGSLERGVCRQVWKR